MISSVWKKSVIAALFLLALLVCLSACTDKPSRSELQERLDADVDPSTPAPPQEQQDPSPVASDEPDTPQPSQPAQPSQPEPDEPEQPDAPVVPAVPEPAEDGMPSDEDLRQLLTGMEIVLTGSNTFTFRSASELTNEELYLSFLWCTPYDTLLQCWDDGAQNFRFSQEFITAHLSSYYQDFYFDVRQNTRYNDVARAIVTPLASGFGGGRNLVIEDKTLDDDVLTVTAAFYPMGDTTYDPECCQLRKVYQLELYDGGQYFLSAIEQPLDACDDPETAALLLTMLRRAQIVNYPGDENERLSYTKQAGYLAAYDAFVQYITAHAGDYAAYAQAEDGWMQFYWFEDGLSCVLYAAGLDDVQLLYRPSDGVHAVDGLSLPA